MNNGNIRQHISGQFNKELGDIRHKVLIMGGLVEQQIDHAIQAFITGDMESAEQVIKLGVCLTYNSLNNNNFSF